MKKLYRYFEDCGRMGSLESLFIEEESVVNEMMGKRIYLGEVLGKHSDIDIMLLHTNTSVVSDDEEKIEWLESLLGSNVSGIDIVEHYQEQVEDEIEE